MDVLSFEQLPSVVVNLTNEVKELKILLLSKTLIQAETDNPLNIREVAKLTELSVPTLYGYVQRNEMPYYKTGNRLRFFRSEIISWIKQGRQKTTKNIIAEADSFLSSKKKGVHNG